MAQIDTVETILQNSTPIYLFFQKIKSLLMFLFGLRRRRQEENPSKERKTED